jgi:putative ubiquitin-RnfH superfamily antitoxin RatB of RatAB toxin-antitoxin module
MAPADHAQGAALIRVELAWSPGPKQVELESITLPAGAKLADALQASTRLKLLWPEGWESLPCGVWSKLRPHDHPLRDGDRIELYRPLRVDPKEARRQRYRKSRTKRSGPPGSSL